MSSAHHHLPLKALADLNAQLSQPLEITLSRPQQKTYANIHGLYLLLRSTRLGIVEGDRKPIMKLNPTILAS